MFLEKLKKQNPKLIEATLALHKQHLITPDSYILDYEAIINNARMMVQVAKENGIKLYAMTKQFGRIPFLAKKIVDVGFDGIVCVDYREALLMIEHGIKIGHVGHLVQIPSGLIRKIIAAKPEIITVYSIEKANEINLIAKELGLVQPIMLKIYHDDDIIYPQQGAGFHLHEIAAVATILRQLTNIKLEGITHFPCFLYDNKSKKITTTNNAATVLAGKKLLQEMGIPISQINLPSSTCSASIPLIKQLGGTHGEPGHGLTGTTMYHANTDEGEQLASLYFSEISHRFQGKSYSFGGGHYRRSHLTSALVNGQIVSVTEPAAEAIDYHFELAKLAPIGSSVIMSFRTQIFVTRSQVILVDGVQRGQPTIMARYDALGRQL